MRNYTFHLDGEEERKFEQAFFDMNQNRKHPLDKKDVLTILAMKFANGEIDVDG